MRWLPVAALLALLAPASLRAADPPRIEGLTASLRDGRVSVALQLESAFRNGETVEALRSGLPTGFTYEIELFRDRPNWFDGSIATVKIEAVCTYNSLTREYLLNYRRDRRLVRSESFTDLAELRRRMTTIQEDDLFAIGDWKPHKLKVRARAVLLRGWLMYVIPWELETRWRETRLRVAGGTQ